MMAAMTATPHVPVGPTMRRARELAGLDRGVAASGLGVRARDLRVIESGRRPADVVLVERALQVYGGDRLDLPPRQDLIHPLDRNVLVVGDEQVRIDPNRSDDTAVLVGYVAAVRRQRGLEVAAVVRFRANDLVQLAAVLDLEATDLVDRLRRVTGLDSDPAVQAARRIVLAGLALAIAGPRAQDAPRFWTPAAAGLRQHDAQRRAASKPTGRARRASPESSGSAGASASDSSAGSEPVVTPSSWLARADGRPTSRPGSLARLDALAELVAEARSSES